MVEHWFHKLTVASYKDQHILGAELFSEHVGTVTIWSFSVKLCATVGCVFSRDSFTKTFRPHFLWSWTAASIAAACLVTFLPLVLIIMSKGQSFPHQGRSWQLHMSQCHSPSYRWHACQHQTNGSISLLPQTSWKSKPCWKPEAERERVRKPCLLQFGQLRMGCSKEIFVILSSTNEQLHSAC